MPLPDNPNQISMTQIAAEFGGDVPHQLSEYHDKGNAPASGEIQMGADFHGTADTDTWRSHYFSSTTQFTVTTAGVCTISMIGGGGAGGFVDTGQYDQHSGAGGAGGVRSGTVTLATGTYQALVGAGASGTSNSNSAGGECYIWHYGSSAYAQYTGGTTTGDVRVSGGARGGDGDGDSGSSSPRASGGGASSNSYSGGSGNTANISPAVGHNGSAGYDANAHYSTRGYTSGAGGGAGEAGGTDDYDEGGDGTPIRIHTGPIYARGGGGGAFHRWTNSYYGDGRIPGGNGGGGSGGYWVNFAPIYSNNSASNMSGNNGIATTGGGGGGGKCFGNWPGEGQGGNGGSGCLWIAYQIDGDNASSLAFSGTVGQATNTYQA